MRIKWVFYLQKSNVTLTVWKPFIRLTNIKLPRGTTEGTFLALLVSEICQVRPCCNSRQAVACIMAWFVLFIIGLLYGLLYICLYNNKYCPLAWKLILLLISVLFPRLLFLSWGLLNEPCLLQDACAFRSVLKHCRLASNAAWIPQAIILAL